ncbi:MAG: hypothetical protein RR063_11305 [Anaerovoracaceae bacterium]
MITDEQWIEEQWREYPLCLQMVEVGGAVEHALRFSDEPDVVKCEVKSACDLLDLIMKIRQNEPIAKELILAKETLCDFFLGDNLMKTEANEIKAYYDKYMNEYIALLKNKI